MRRLCYTGVVVAALIAPVVPAQAAPVKAHAARQYLRFGEARARIRSVLRNQFTYGFEEGSDTFSCWRYRYSHGRPWTDRAQCFGGFNDQDGDHWCADAWVIKKTYYTYAYVRNFELTDRCLF